MKQYFAQHYALTPDQTQAISHLDNFLASNNCCFILRGYAGTGKTFLLNGIARYFKEIGKQVVFAAPTGRAAKVITERTGESAYTIHKTIYSGQKLSEFKTEDVDGTETFKFSFGLRENEDNVDTVYAIDEASMISNVYSEGEFFRFGSGYLLNDLFEFTKANEAGIRRKIIFVGDSAQLPPVNMKISPALSEELLGKRFVGVSSYELTEVVRQKSSSPILTNATDLRDAIRREAFYKLKLHYDTEAMHQLQAAGLSDTYAQLRSTHGVENTVMIAYSNSIVNNYNKMARTQLFPGVPHITPSDRVILVSNNYNYGLDLFNGDFATVIDVATLVSHRMVTIKKKSKIGEVVAKSVTLSFREVLLSFEQSGGPNTEVTCLVCEQLLYSDHRDLTSDETKALYIDFKIRNDRLRPGSDEFRKELQSDGMFNALRIKFGYAVTCHKAQGGEWPAVIVDAGRHGAKNNSNYFRWLYTAITRARTSLHVLDAPDYNNGDKLKLVSMPGTPIAEPATKTVIPSPPRPSPVQAWTIPPAPAPEVPVSHLTLNINMPQPTPSNLESVPVITDSPEPAAGNYQPEFLSGQESLSNIYQKVVELTTAASYQIVDLSHQQYHEIYSFKLGDTLTRITINYNGKSKVTKMRPNDMTEHHTDLINRLKPLKGFQAAFLPTPLEAGTTVQFTFPEPFLAEFYQTVKSKIDSSGIQITSVKHLQFHEVYTFVRDGLQAVYRFYYNGKKEFTTVSPIVAKTTGLVDELNALLV